MSHRFNSSVRNSFVCRDCLTQNVVEVVDKKELKQHLRKNHHRILVRDPAGHYIPYSAFCESFEKCEERRLVAFAEVINKLCKQAAFV